MTGQSSHCCTSIAPGAGWALWQRTSASWDCWSVLSSPGARRERICPCQNPYMPVIGFGYFQCSKSRPAGWGVFHTVSFKLIF